MAIIIGIAISFLLGEGILRLIHFEYPLLLTKIQIGWPDPITLAKKYVADRELLWVSQNYYTKISS